MPIKEFEIKSHVDTINFILEQSKIDYPQLEKYEKKYQYKKMNLLELYNYMKYLSYTRGSDKDQLIATPERIYKGDSPYLNCAVKTYLFVCLLRYLHKKNHPLKKFRFYIEISGKKKDSIKSIDHIYMKVLLDREIRYFDFTYPSKNNLFKPLYYPKIAISKEVIF